MSEIVVLKLNLERRETWRYSGQVLRRWRNAVLLEANFNRDDLPFHGILLRRGDRFIEKFYTDRWYNIFEIHDLEDDRIKGWYCNICCPAELADGQVSYVDLALDLLVFPDGNMLVLDEDEFADLQLDPETRRKALAALAELQSQFTESSPFDLETV